MKNQIEKVRNGYINEERNYYLKKQIMKIKKK